MQAQAQVLDDNLDFDRAAAETYLRILGVEPPPGRRPAKPVRQDPLITPHTAPEPPAIVPTSRPKTNVRTWVAAAAAAIAVAAPVSIGGAGLAYWSAAGSPGAGPERVQIERPEAEAFMVTAPIPAAVKSLKPSHGGRQHNRRPHPRSQGVSTRHKATRSDDDDVYVAPPIDFPF